LREMFKFPQVRMTRSDFVIDSAAILGRNDYVTLCTPTIPSFIRQVLRKYQHCCRFSSKREEDFPIN
jgi:hypothetical protein